MGAHPSHQLQVRSLEDALHIPGFVSANAAPPGQPLICLFVHLLKSLFKL